MKGREGKGQKKEGKGDGVRQYEGNKEYKER